jgi:DNA-binding LacI/PurR family transcriptional regulator
VLKNLLALPSDERPTAIFDPWDADMEAVYFVLTRLGVNVPDEISLVSFGGAKRGNTLARRLTAITVDEARTAAMTVKLLDEMRRGQRSIDSDAQLTLPLGFHSGETIAPPAIQPTV